MRCLPIQNGQTVCPNMIQLTFHNYFPFFSVYYYYQRVMLWQSLQNSVFLSFYDSVNNSILFDVWYSCKVFIYVFVTDRPLNSGVPDDFD